MLWNRKKIGHISPKNYNIQTISIDDVVINAGQNTLRIEGLYNRGRDLTIDNVTMVRYGTTENIVVNGDFE